MKLQGNFFKYSEISLKKKKKKTVFQDSTTQPKKFLEKICSSKCISLKKKKKE